MTHTPGPWTVCSQPNQSSGDEGDLAWWYTLEASKDNHTFAEHEANAHLIAAAPELLEALKTAEWWLENTGSAADISSDALAEIKAAIAKAEGK